MGLEAFTDEHCYTYATFNEANKKNRFCLFGHVDVSPDAPAENVKPVVSTFLGEDLKLVFTTIPKDEIHGNTGDTLVTSDGSTLLGSDDKSGIAIIMIVLEELIKM